MISTELQSEFNLTYQLDGFSGEQTEKKCKNWRRQCTRCCVFGGRPLRFVEIISTIRGNQNVNPRDRYFYTDVNLC